MLAQGGGGPQPLSLEGGIQKKKKKEHALERTGMVLMGYVAPQRAQKGRRYNIPADRILAEYQKLTKLEPNTIKPVIASLILHFPQKR